MRKNTFNVVLAILLSLILISSGIGFYYLYNAKEKQIADIKKSLETLQLNYNSLKRNYENMKLEYQQTKKTNELLKKESISLNQSMKQIELQVDQSLDKLHDFDIRVRQSMEWFAKNNNINHSDAYNLTREKLKERCIRNETANCHIDISCMYDVNYEYGIRYIEDTSSIRKEDFMLNLSLIDEFKGGDCEDFSLLFMAEYNYLFGECQKMGFRRENITTATRDMDEKLTGQYMYIVCGVFNPKILGGQLGGHCVDALTNKPIIISQDVYDSIKNAVLVEPQTGEYMLHMNKTEYVKLFDDGMAPDTLYYLWFVITDTDLKIFYEWSEKIEWIGYTEFLKESEKLNETLQR